MQPPCLLATCFLGVLCDPADYKEAMIQLRTDNIDKEFRIYLAAKALNLVSAFDGGIASSILMNNPDKVQKSFLNYLTYPFEKQYMLPKGTNPHQSSCLYRFPGGTGTVGSLQKQQGKELSYNTISDISFAWEQICMLSLNLKNQFSVFACTPKTIVSDNARKHKHKFFDHSVVSGRSSM